MALQLQSGRLPASLAQRSRAGANLAGSSKAIHDARWPRVAVALAALLDKGRRAVRIVDIDCGTGCLLLHAVRYAREMGFKAIEGRGIDGSPALIGRARAAAARLHDSAIGVVFEVADVRMALAAEREFPADIVIWHGSRPNGDHASLLLELQGAGDLVIGDPWQSGGGGTAA